MAITKFIKNHYDFEIKDFVAPISRFIKFPITLDKLLDRISNLASQHNILLDDKLFAITYRMSPEGIKKAKHDLRGKGGIYIWYCHKTGYFYLGSAQVFFGRNARLSNYLMPSRLLNTHKNISKDLAKDLLKYGYERFSLVIVEQFNVGMNIEMLLYQEQLWMMLYPTYNRSLKVGSNEGLPMPEAVRQQMSTSIFSYEVVDRKILPDSEKEHKGIKKLARDGISSIEQPNVIIPISNFDLSPLLKTGALYKDRFVFTSERLVGEKLINWKPMVLKAASKQSGLTKGNDQRSNGVYVYKYLGSDANYTIADFVEFILSVKACQDKYQMSKSNFQRLRRYNAPHLFRGKEYLFSNYKLHN
uniref:GIY-YIG homing endonuclease n=1 Tax=Blastosporella zonata TaxID=530045 RepID=A0A386TXZ8_9AGAR|nr:GIY-YIG homing endonuclease [Blastosporella zonata]YP_009517202.1 GIY-YIG homing endonuclease [Blastosporella zonata]AYE93094.1 GIY-YIG homing endonuclease [Blastosporella zonata]AYE93095.1 GIY-YIG homing endonuclease [Blastosporella zonata]